MVDVGQVGILFNMWPSSCMYIYEVVVSASVLANLPLYMNILRYRKYIEYIHEFQ